jgi:hypothetical protein
MSIFVQVPNNKMRVKCTICNNEVSKAEEGKKMEMHQQYHILGDQMLSKSETACPLCLTPMSIRGQSFVKHLEGFHNIAHKKALEMNKKAKLEAETRNIEMPKPTFKLPQSIQKQVQEKAEQLQMIADEKRINLPVKKGRPRVKAGLPNETDEERAKRMNRENVMKFRDRKRAEKGIAGPKRIIKKQLQEGESVEDYDRKLRAEAMRRYRAKLKAKKQE